MSPAPEPLALFGLGKAAQAQTHALQNWIQSNLNKKSLIYLYPQGEHPIPGQGSLQSGSQLLLDLQNLPSESVPVFCISGGATSQFFSPWPGWDLSKEQALSQALLSSGAPIEEMNTLRRQTSITRNGGLLGFGAFSKALGLLSIDIPSGDPRFLGSGPLSYEAPNSSLLIEIGNKRLPVSEAIRWKHWIESPEFQTRPKPKCSVDLLSIADGTKLLQAAETSLRRQGWTQVVSLGVLSESLTSALQRHLQTIQKSSDPIAIISGGEIPISMGHQAGKGGRCTHFALQLAQTLFEKTGSRKVQIFCFASDGVDGTSGGSGALLDSEIWGRLDRASSESLGFLERFDSATFLKQIGALYPSIQTNLNLMDLRVITLGPV